MGPEGKGSLKRLRRVPKAEGLAQAEALDYGSFTNDTKDVAISLNEVMLVFFKCGPQMPSISIIWDNCYRRRSQAQDSQ